MAFDAIEICFGEFNMKAEDHIMKAVQQVDVNVDKEKLIEAIKSKDFVDELIGYIFAHPDDDYMTMECICRKLHKHGLIEKKDGEWTTDFIDHKTEPQTHDIHTNTHECVKDTHDKTEPTISKMEQVDKDINVRSKDEPTTQTETQNSNLTFKTLEYCDICDHKGCEECIANALDEHCIPSQFKKQIEDECAKEYEELGLKELKELIKADRKTESNSEKPNNCEETDCDTCRYAGECDWEPWQECPYESKTEPTISKMEQVDESQIQLTAKCLNCNNSKACKENHWEGCVYEPKDEKTCETCRHWKYIAHEWQCEACKCQGYEPKDEPQTERSK